VIDPQEIPFAVDVEIAKVIYEVHLWVENGAGTAVPMAVDDDSLFDDDADSKSEDKGFDRNNEDGLNRKENASDQPLNKLAGGDNTGHKSVALGEVTTIAGQPIDGVLAAGSLGVGQELPADPLESSMDGNVVDDEKLLMSDAIGKAKQSEVVAAVTDQAGAIIADHVPMDSPELMQSPDDSCDKLKQLAAIPEASQSVAAGRKRRTSITDENSLARAETLKAECNGGNNPSPSSISCNKVLQTPLNLAVSNLDAIDISLGVEESHLAKSIQVLNSYDKGMVSQVGRDGMVEGTVYDIVDEESDEELDRFILNNLYGGIIDDLMDNGVDNKAGCQNPVDPGSDTHRKKVRSKKRKKKLSCKNKS
jgi:hypothetical protein